MSQFDTSSKHMPSASVLGQHESFHVSPAHGKHVSRCVPRHKSNALLDMHTKQRQVCIQENQRQVSTLHVVRHWMGLVCPIRGKNHIPGALQVLFTKEQTQERRGHEATILQSFWSQEALRGNSGFTDTTGNTHHIPCLLQHCTEEISKSNLYYSHNLTINIFTTHIKRM